MKRKPFAWAYCDFCGTLCVRSSTDGVEHSCHGIRRDMVASLADSVEMPSGELEPPPLARSPWNIGDVVRLCSGGRAMTVVFAGLANCDVAWLVDGVLQRVTLPVEAVTRAQPEKT